MDSGLEHEVLAAISREGRAWLIRALADRDASKVSSSFTVAPRFVRGEPFVDGGSAPEGLAWLFTGAPADELARVVLLAYAASLVDDPVALALEWYRRGDNREKRAVLRGLPLLATPPAHVALATLACRTSVGVVFEGIACENPFPADHFPDGAFNQLVLKALFTGVHVGRIIGLERRRNPELTRMAADYASERRAAGRLVPTDVDRVLDHPGAPAGLAGETE